MLLNLNDVVKINFYNEGELVTEDYIYIPNVKIRKKIDDLFEEYKEYVREEVGCESPDDFVGWLNEKFPNDTIENINHLFNDITVLEF
jgi:predicted RNA-binding protein